MREHASEATPAEDVAARVGLSRGPLLRLVPDQLNTTPQVILSAVRVEELFRRLVEQEDL
jgi:transcriptional regulator GlxA family with amidase domain